MKNGASEKNHVVEFLFQKSRPGADERHCHENKDFLSKTHSQKKRNGVFLARKKSDLCPKKRQMIFLRKKSRGDGLAQTCAQGEIDNFIKNLLVLRKFSLTN